MDLRREWIVAVDEGVQENPRVDDRDAELARLVELGWAGGLTDEEEGGFGGEGGRQRRSGGAKDFVDFVPGKVGNDTGEENLHGFECGGVDFRAFG